MKFNQAEKFIYNKLQQELPEHLYYHSIYHVKDVLSAAIRLAESEGIEEDGLLLLKTAVLFHDSGFTVQSKDHETIGCNIVKEVLPQFDYSQQDIDMIAGMIMATKIPQTPHNLLEQIIADADLDYLGREDYWTISSNLYKEITMYSMLNETDWLKIQISFLEQHKYFTNTAIQTRNEKKKEYICILKDMLALQTKNN